MSDKSYGDTFEAKVLQRLTRIETKLEGNSEVKTIAYEADVRSKQNEKDIKIIKDNYKWLWRTVLGAIIVGVGGFAFSFITYRLGG